VLLRSNLDNTGVWIIPTALFGSLLSFRAEQTDLSSWCDVAPFGCAVVGMVIALSPNWFFGVLL
jgi:hypothetical protein